MSSQDEKMNAHLQQLNLIQSLNVSKLDDSHISFIEELILKDLNSTFIQNIHHLILPIASSWAKYDSPVKLKLLSCKILGEIISNIDDSFVLEHHVLPITQCLLRDNQALVRSSVCRHLPSLLRKVDQLSENVLLTSLLDAARDDSSQVRCAVLDVLVDSEPFINKAYINEFILPTLKKLIESCLLPAQDEFFLHVSKLYSKMCSTYKENTDLEDQAWFVSHFVSLCQTDKEAAATSLSSSLVSMMLFIDSTPDLCELLVSCVVNLSTSPYASVRQILSSTLFQIVKTCEQKSRHILLKVLVTLLQEKLEVLKALIPHLSSIISTLLESGETEERAALIASLRTCEETLSRSHTWRLHVLYMQQVQTLASLALLSPSYLLDHFNDILFHRIKNSRPIPSRLAASKTLLLLLTKINNDSSTSKCISRIHKDLYCSRSFYDRNLFVKICHQTIQMFSFDDFKKYFLPSLILLSADPVANIRYSVTGLLVHSSVRLMSCPDPELSSRIEQCLRELKNDPDADVSANVNFLVSKLKEKRASALLNLLIEPFILQEDLVEETPSLLDSTFSQQGTSDRPIMIHPYMKASMEKEFLIDAGIPFNSTPMSENYRPITIKGETTNKMNYSNAKSALYDGKDNLISNINNLVNDTNPRSLNSEERFFAGGKTIIIDTEFSNGRDNFVGNKQHESGGNMASHDNQRIKSKLGIPKKFTHHERFPCDQLVVSENLKDKGTNNVVKGSQHDISPCCIDDNKNFNDDTHVNSTPLVPIRTNKSGIKFNGAKPNGDSVLFSKNSHGNNKSYFELTPKIVNELDDISSTDQRNNQNNSNSNLLRYQMFKPKNIVKYNEPNTPEINNNNAKINSPGSKLKRAFLSTLGRNQRVKQKCVNTFSKDVQSDNSHETIRQFPSSSSTETTCNTIKPVEITNVDCLQRKNDSNLNISPGHMKSEDGSNISETKTLLKQTSHLQSNFQINLFSPKEHKRKSIHVMESFYSEQKKDCNSCIQPVPEKSSGHLVETEYESSASHEVEENPSLSEIENQNLLPNFQNKRKSMYQPSDRDSLLTSFFKGQSFSRALKYQPKVMIDRKNSVPSLNNEPCNSPFSEHKIGSINNTLPRTQKIIYLNQSLNSNSRKYKIAETSDQEHKHRKSPEIHSQNPQSFAQSNSPDNVHLPINNFIDNSTATSTPDFLYTNDVMPCNKENIKNDSPIKNLGRDILDANIEPLELKYDQRYPSGPTRQPKINHLDLQNNEFLFYKHKNCSDVEISHVDSPRNSFVNSSASDQDKISSRVPMNTVDISKHLNFQGHCNKLLPRILATTDLMNNQTPPCKSSSDNDITQKILNLTNEVETIDHYLNSDSISNDNIRHCISPLKEDNIKSPNTTEHEEDSSQNLNLHPGMSDSHKLPPTGIMKRSPNLDKKKVMFLNDKVVTPEECQRLSLNFERELNELNSKIEQINEEIRIETLNLEEAKNNQSRNNSTKSHIQNSQNLNSSKSAPAYPMVNFTQAGHIETPDLFSNQHNQSTVCSKKNIDINIISEKISEHGDKLNTQPALSNISENQVLEVTKNNAETKPPLMSSKTQIMKEKITCDSGLTCTMQKACTDLREPPVESDQNMKTIETRVFRESKLLKRHAHRRSYDERISKLDFQGFSKKNDFNKHSTYRRSFDDKNSTSNESLVTNLPPKVPSVNTLGTTSVVNSGLKKVSNYQIFSDRRKNILENKSFTVRIGSRNPQQNRENQRDSSPSLSQQEVIQVDTESKIIKQCTPEAHNTTIAAKRNESGTPSDSYLKETTSLDKASQIIGKPRVSVSPLKYHSASLKKSIPGGYAEGKNKPAEQTSMTQAARYGKPDVTMRNRSPSPQTIINDSLQKQNSRPSNKVQYTEVSWRRQTSKMQAPRSISQIIESQIPGLNENNNGPPITTREKSIPDISAEQNPRVSPNSCQIKTRLISMSPTPSKIIQSRYDTGIEINGQSVPAKKQPAPPTRIERFAYHSNPGDNKMVKTIVSLENSPIDTVKIPESLNSGGKLLLSENVTKLVKVGSRTNHATDSQSDSTAKSGVTTYVVVRRSPSSTSDSGSRYHKPQGNLCKNSSESLTNRSEQSSEALESSSKIPGKKNLKGSKLSCLRSEQDSFYTNCHMSSDERPRSCIIPNGIHMTDKSNASLKLISEENLQHNNRRASSAGAIPTVAGGGSKLPRRSIKF